MRRSVLKRVLLCFIQLQGVNCLVLAVLTPTAHLLVTRGTLARRQVESAVLLGLEYSLVDLLVVAGVFLDRFGESVCLSQTLLPLHSHRLLLQLSSLRRIAALARLNPVPILVLISMVFVRKQ